MLKSEETLGVDFQSITALALGRVNAQLFTFSRIPVNLGSTPRGQREWLLEFLYSPVRSFIRAKRYAGRTFFVQMQVVDENEQLRKTFMNAMMKRVSHVGAMLAAESGKQPISRRQIGEIRVACQQEERVSSL